MKYAIGGLKFEMGHEMAWNWVDTSRVGIYEWIWMKCALGLNFGEESGFVALGSESIAINENLWKIDVWDIGLAWNFANMVLEVSWSAGKIWGQFEQI
jgi:hypothetical protein